MPYRIEYREDDGGVITEYSGELTEEEFIQCTQEKFDELDKLTEHRYSISDFTKVTKFSVGMEVIKANAMLSNHALRVHSGGAMEVVVNSNLLMGLGNIWRVFTGGVDTRLKLFRSREKAEIWVREQLSKADTDIA